MRINAASVWANVTRLLEEVPSPLKTLPLHRLCTSEASALALSSNVGLAGTCLDAAALKEIDSILSQEKFEGLEVVCLSRLFVTKDQVDDSGQANLLATIQSWIPQLHARKDSTILKVDL